MENGFSNNWEFLEENRFTLSRLTSELQFAQHPELEKKFGKSGKDRCTHDNDLHFRYLTATARFNQPQIFSKYLQWAAYVLQNRNIPIAHLKENLLFMDAACHVEMPLNAYPIVSGFINAGIAALEQIPPAAETYLVASNPLQTEARLYQTLLLNADRQGARKVIDQLLNKGCSLTDIYEFIFQTTQYEIGLLWEQNKISVAHEHYCTAVTQSIIAGLYTEVFTSQKKSRKMIACAVGGELHEIGVRMLSDFFELDGWNAYYLGANMPEDHLIALLLEQHPDLLAISVSMSYNVGKAESLINKIKSRSELSLMKIMVGGYSFNNIENLWRTIGADAHAPTARQAISLANALI